MWVYTIKLGGRFGYFLFFSARGRGRGSARRREGGGDFLLKIPGGEVSRAGGSRGARGREGVCGEFGGRGAKYFFFGAEIPTKQGICYANAFAQSIPRSTSGNNLQKLGSLHMQPHDVDQILICYQFVPYPPLCSGIGSGRGDLS